MMQTLLIVALITVFIVPLFQWVAEFGLQPSISDNFRKLQEKYGKGSMRPWLFWLWLAAVGGLFFAYFQNGWAFGTLVGLMLTGTAAEFWKNKEIEVPHIVGATGGIIMGHLTVIMHGFEIGQGFVGIASLVGGLLIVLLGKIFKTENYTYFVEIGQFAILIIMITLMDFVL